MTDSKQTNILLQEWRRFNNQRVRDRGYPNGRPYGQKPKDDMKNTIWDDNGITMLKSRKFVDHSKNRQRRLFMTDICEVHRIRFCRFFEERFIDMTPYNRVKFVKQRRKNKRITKDMLDF